MKMQNNNGNANNSNENVEENKNEENQMQNNGQQNANDAGVNSQKDNDTNSGSNDKNDEGKNFKTFTQEDVNRMMTREKKQGRNSVFNELGIDPNDTKSIEAIKAFMNAQKTVSDDENGEDVSEKIDELERRAAIAEAKTEAMMLGVKSQFVDDVVVLASNKMTELGEEAEFKTVIGELKQKYSLWFGNDEDDDKSVGKRGTGSSIGSDSGSNGSSKDEGIGKRLAAKRKHSGKNFSYWGKNN